MIYDSQLWDASSSSGGWVGGGVYEMPSGIASQASCKIIIIARIDNCDDEICTYQHEYIHKESILLFLCVLHKKCFDSRKNKKYIQFNSMDGNDKFTYIGGYIDECYMQ